MAKKHTVETTQKRIRTMKYLEAAIRAAGEKDISLKLHESERSADVIRIWYRRGEPDGYELATVNIESDSPIAMLHDVAKTIPRLFF